MTAPSPANQNQKTALFAAFAFCGVLACLPLIGVIVPRFIAFVPALLLLIGMAGFCISPRRFFAENSKTFRIPVLVFLALATLSSLWAIAPDIVLDRVMKLLPVLLPVIFLPVPVRSLPGNVARFHVVLFPLGVIAACLLCAVELYFDAPLYQLIRGKSEDAVFNLSLLNRGVTSIVLTFLIALPLVLKASLPQVQKSGILTMLMVLTALVLYKTDSQSAQLAVVVGLFFVFVFPYRFKAAWIVLGVLVSALILSAPWLVQYMFAEFAGNTQEIPWLQSGYAADRMEIWDSVARYVMQNPFYGFGIEATRAVEAFDTAQIYRHSVTVLHPHNFALQLWIEFGVIGAVLGSVLLGFIFYRLSCFPAEDARLALPALMGFLSVSATGYGLWQGWWIGLAVTLSACILTARRASSLFCNVRA